MHEKFPSLSLEERTYLAHHMSLIVHLFFSSPSTSIQWAFPVDGNIICVIIIIATILNLKSTDFKFKKSLTQTSQPSTAYSSIKNAFLKAKSCNYTDTPGNEHVSSTHN